MPSYLVTHSLLSSWLYLMKENPYEDLTTERDPKVEFMKVLRREPTETTEAMLNGIMFEDMVTDIVHGRINPDAKWFQAASLVASKVKGGILQYKASRRFTVAGREIVLYGRFDCLKAGKIIDIKFSKGYDRGKFLTSTQHPTYLAIMPEAKEFSYVISNGTDVWTETYRRDETPDILPIISDFFDWLNTVGLMQVYEEHWVSK